MNRQSGNLAVIGAQWGDEGKGKIVDLLCESFDVVARFQGGHNAGHTVKFRDLHYMLQLIPSGILHPEKLCILGGGMVIDPEALLKEVAKLRAAGVVIEDNLRISDSAHCILPYHQQLDVAREEFAGEGKIGTTGRGIGPAYETKVGRAGILVRDLLDEKTLREKIGMACVEKNALLTGLYGKPALDPEALVDSYLDYGRKISRWVTNTSLLLHDQKRAGKRIMFEGAQGTLLDVDHGTYPFVTSSNCVVGAISTGLGVAPKEITSVLAVAKAYSTRVGGGPFPTELLNDTGEHLRTRGNEYGTTTGRPRRTGWLDLPVLRTAVQLNGVEEIALTKLDVFDELGEIPVCTSYQQNGSECTIFPRLSGSLEGTTCNYRTMKGWKRSIVGISSFDDLPEEAKEYIRFVESEIECRISIVSTGPKREETISRE